MVWLALALVPVAVLAWAAFTLLRGGTIYFAHPNGFRAHSFGAAESKLRPVPRDRYERILQRFMQGDLFDTLWISHQPQDHEGVVLSLKAAEIEMDVTFRPLKQADKLAAFRQSMESWGYGLRDENPWNVGMGEDFESVTLEYSFEKDIDQVRLGVERALDALEGPAGSELFVNVWHSHDGPRGTGIKVVPKRDRLAQVP